MVASDVHGKNHHVNGTFGRHIKSLKVLTGQGQVIECSRENSADLFLATIGGMGLTGHILEVEFVMEKIPSPWIYQETYRISGLSELLEKLKESGKDWPMTVAWVDTIASGKSMGRGILFVGRWATKAEAKAHVPKAAKGIVFPFSIPSGLLNRFTIGLFNRAVYFSHFQKKKTEVANPDKYFYPLDSFQHWNRLYGEAGVTQHQSVIPEESGAVGIRAMVSSLKQAGDASFLTVIKDCGPQGEGMLSFPRSGMSLALDLPIRETTQQTVQQLNETVKQKGGRIYLTKDGLSSREDFEAMEDRIEQFNAVRRKYDPEGRLRSAQSMRLFGF